MPILADKLDPFMTVAEPPRAAVWASKVVPVRLTSWWRVRGPEGVDFGARETWWQWGPWTWALRVRLFGSCGLS